ncbi:MAG TPA: right-handed parallel beta-helix repeat-containing protein [Candidatus Eisenbacteria bacterium]|nr:right-handed parallel beta-helix repeat-containing protein [Candidatus Eisenbacteria bacterium]
MNRSRACRRTPELGHRGRHGILFLSAALLALAAPPAVARVLVLQPSVATTDEEFERVANTLQPGDTLVLRGGTYSQTARRAVTVNGTPAQPILIRAADGESPLLTRPIETMNTANNIELVSCSYLTIRGIRFEGGSTGVRIMGGHHITVEDCEVFGTGNNALSMNSGDCDSLVIRRNEIHHTGLSTAGDTEGEGMYVGCNNNTCRVTNSLFESNYIHHLRATSTGGNDGIEVKVGSHGNIIRNNVIHDTTIGMRYPGIFVYGGGSRPNIVEGNVLWNCGEAIQVVSDAEIRNNLILNSDVGITAAPHSQVTLMRNVTIANNTIHGNDQGIYVRWSGTTNMALANNAIYSPSGTAVNASGLGASLVLANYVEGGLSGVTLDSERFLFGGSAASVFRDAASMDLWPTSAAPFLGRASASFVPANDFNERARTAPFDVGAYERDGLATNPGWRIQPGFKSSGPALDTMPPSAPSDLRASGSSAGSPSASPRPPSASRR